MPERYGIFEGTIGEREYAHGVSEGRAAADSLACGTYALGLEWVADALADAQSASRKTRTFALGWLRGYRDVTR